MKCTKDAVIKREDAEKIADALLQAMPGSWVDGIFIMRAMNQSQLDVLKNNWVQLLVRLSVEEKS